jgi:hypothetical protein
MKSAPNFYISIFLKLIIIMDHLTTSKLAMIHLTLLKNSNADVSPVSEHLKI